MTDEPPLVRPGMLNLDDADCPEEFVFGVLASCDNCFVRCLCFEALHQELPAAEAFLFVAAGVQELMDVDHDEGNSWFDARWDMHNEWLETLGSLKPEPSFLDALRRFVEGEWNDDDDDDDDDPLENFHQ